MRIIPSFILLAALLAGCNDISQDQSNSNKKPTQLIENETSEVTNVHDLETSKYDTIFSQIKPVYRALNLQWIEAYCMKRDIGELDGDCIRLFCQPMGFVSEAKEINLTQQQITIYPGTNSNEKVVQIPLDEPQVAWLRKLVTSKEFQEIPSENKKIGTDGVSYLLEVSIDDKYFWKLHWIPENRELIEIINYIRLLAEDRKAKLNSQNN